MNDEQARRFAIVIVHPDGRRYCDGYSSSLSEAQRRADVNERSANPGVKCRVLDGAAVFAAIGGSGFGWLPKEEYCGS